MKRSTCASGSGYVPSYSTGFCVANTMNGLASSCECTSTVTWRSCMHSSRPDCVFGDARLIPSTSTLLALVVDVGADDVGRQQVGGALHARELAVERARQSARESRLADARIVLDEDVALGQQGDHDVLEHVVAHLDRTADVVLDLPREVDGGFDLLVCDGSRQRLDRLHVAFQTLTVV